jgi:hypothetical protein
VAKVHDILEMRQASQNHRTPQKESHSQKKQMTTVGYISYTEEIVKASWPNYQHDGAATFKLSEHLPMPPTFSSKDIPGGQTEALNVGQIKGIACDPAESDVSHSPG